MALCFALRSLTRTLLVALSFVTPLPATPHGQSLPEPIPCLAARFLPDLPAAEARCGAAVAIAGGIFAIGIPGRDEVRLGSIDALTGTPRLDAVLAGPAGSRFGASLAAAGDLLVVGAPLLPPGGGAIVVELAQAAPIATLRPPLATPGARAGTAVALAIDAGAPLVLIGAPEHGPAGAPTGAVFPFTAAAGGWIALAPLLPADGSSEGGFGEAIAMSARSIAVGAPRGPGARPETGAAHLFARTAAPFAAGAPVAIPLAHAALPDGLADEGFAAAVAFAGADLAIGVPHRDAAAPGAGAIALVDGATLAALAALAPAPAARISPDRVLARAMSPVAAGLGASLAAADGRLYAGAPADGALAPLGGAVAVFARDAATGWREAGLILPTPALSGAEFGRAIAAGGGIVLAGAPGDPERCGGAFGCDAGAASILLAGAEPDCDGDGKVDPCARHAAPELDSDRDGALDRCRFRRGDLDGDGALTLADPLLWFLPPAGAPGGMCPAAADANGDAALDLADPVFLLSHLFLAAPPPPPPFPECGLGAPPLPCAHAGCSP